MEMMQKFLEDYRAGMTPFQEKYFVLANSHGTAYGQYHQALREMMSRIESLRNDLYSKQGYYKVNLKLEQCMKKLKYGKELAKKEAIIDIKMLKSQIIIILMRIKENWRSFHHFYTIAEKLWYALGNLTPEQETKLETAEWVHHLKKTAALNILGEGRIRTSTWRLVQTLPVSARVEVNSLMTAPPTTGGSVQPLVEWYLHQTPSQLVDLDSIPSVNIDIHKLLPTIENEIQKYQMLSEQAIGLNSDGLTQLQGEINDD